MNDTAAVEAYLHKHIPLSGEMGARVLQATPELVLLEAPLAPNINHRSTVFGGSLSALAILAGWAMVHFRLRDEGLEVRTVIHGNSVRYEEPAYGTFQARCSEPHPKDWARFVGTIGRRGKGRIQVEVELLSEGVVVGHCTSRYVALERSLADAASRAVPPSE